MMQDFEQLVEKGNHLVVEKKPQLAFYYFIRAVLLAPESPEVLLSCAKTLIELNRPAEAAIYTERAFQFSPTLEVLSWHAKALYQMGHYYEALRCFEKILEQTPDNYTALTQRALCLTQVNRYEEALLVYQEALIQSKNQDPWVAYNYSLCLLAMGHLLQGFIFYENRWLSLLAEKKRHWVFPPSISRETLQGKSIIIYSEQGLGDSIQFFRYIPYLVALGARVFLEINPRLIPLFSNWQMSLTLIATGAPLPSADYHCSIMSLATLFKTQLETIPCSIPYVFPQKKWEYSERKRIGFAWKGSASNSVNEKRCIALKELLSLHQTDFDFICLQQEVFLEEKRILEEYNIAYYSLELNTMLGTAQLISGLDLVITVDTAIAHLAAAMGKIVWILLPFSADWRWFLEREDSPWYPHVTLFRQATLGDWSAPLIRIKEALSRLPEKIIQYDLQEANQQLQKELYSDAEQLFRNILIQEPDCHVAAQGIALAALEQNKLADAIQFMQRAVEISPTVALYRRNLGELLRRALQFDSAIAAHNGAIQLEPNNPENHYLLGIAYNDHRQFELAIHHYRIALSYNPHHGFAWNNLGASLELIGDKEEAKNAYQKAINLNPKHAEAQNNLGALYSEEGGIYEARKCFEAAILANSDFIEAHYNLSLIKTYTHDDPHLSFLKRLELKVKNYPLMTRIHYYFALGKALDDAQQYAQAFEAYTQGNQLYHQHNPWNKTSLQNIVEQLPQIFTASFFEKSYARYETRCPIFIVGMPRAGTTLIEQILASHQNIYGAGELNILDDIIQKASREADLPFNAWVSQVQDDQWEVLGKEYLYRTWQLAPDKKFIVDKMPANCFYVGIIHRMLPHAKIIHAMRDPMDSCFSCFTHLFKDSMFFAYDLKTLGEYYILYAKAMQHWRRMLPKNALFELSYEEMVADHENLSKQLVAYLGLAWDDNCLYFYKNERAVKTASLTQVRKPIYKSSVQRWQHFSENLQPLLEIVAPYRQQKESLV